MSFMKDNNLWALRSESHSPGLPNITLACEILSNICPDATLLKGTPGYERARYTYWTREQVTARPACIFQPRTAPDVSLALLVLQHTRCPFAVKSGGHGKFHGESSITGGITVDLVNLNHVTLNESRTAVTIGPGNRWIDVYHALEPLGLTVVGGRASSVGVGGFLLGGGISYYSNAYGWGLDNIIAYEVVLANGSIITAGHSSHPDIYKALRGGGGNFGIVTSFTLETFPYTGMWGGHLAWKPEHSDLVLKAFLEIGNKAPQDPKAFCIMALAKFESEWLLCGWLSYCDSLEKPPIFDDLLAIPTVANDTKVQDQTEMALAMAQGYSPHMENSLWVACTKVDLRIIHFWIRTWMKEMDLLREVKGFKPQVAIQFITSNVTDRMTRNGGNALGLAGKGPFLMFNAEPAWSESKDNKRVFASLKKVFDTTAAEAERLGLTHNYIYLNYASQFQDAFGTYDVATRHFLQGVSKKYDPSGVFQSLRGAGFKLGGAPQAFEPQLSTKFVCFKPTL